jgi:polyhydroxybutyrate depolymerase
MRTFLLLATLLFPPLTARAWPPGNTTGIGIQFQNLTRHYNVHVPASYDGSVPVPLVLDFHGWMNDPSTQQSLSGFAGLSESVGFIVAYPEGYEGTGTERSWNAGTCCPPATTDNIDDVGFARAVVADIESQANVDPLRVYATGLSNGGGMSHRLACEAADLFAAASPVACPLLLDPFTLCQPFRPISVLHFAGLTDQVVPYNGGQSSVFPSFVAPSSPDSFAYWVSTDGCGNGPPEIVEDLGNGASCDTHTACSAGVEVGFCSIHGALFYGHVLYDNSDNVNVAQRAWTFMSQFTLPPALTTTTTSSTTATSSSTTTTLATGPCSPAPQPACKTASPSASKVTIKERLPDTGDQVRWKWKGQATAFRDFGDPLNTTGYALCIYQGATPKPAARAPAGGTCGTKSCWKALGTKGFGYKDADLTPDGLLKVTLKAGDTGKAQVSVKGKGANLPDGLLSLTTPVTVQLQATTGQCWTATFGTAQTSDAEQFKAKSD